MTLNFSVRPLPVPPETRTRAAAAVRPSAALVLRKDAGRAVRGRHCVFSTAGPDRMRDVINQGGWHLDAFKRNPILLYAHDHAAEPIGKVDGIGVDARGLNGTLTPPPRGLSPLADRIFDLWDGHFLNATSVGFRPLKQAYNEQRGGIDFLEQELLEISIVPVPANAEALGEGRSHADAVLRWIGSGRVEAPSSRWAGYHLEVADDADELVLDVADAPSRGVTRSSGDAIEVIDRAGRLLGPAEVERIVQQQVDRITTQAVAEVLTEAKARLSRGGR